MTSAPGAGWRPEPLEDLTAEVFAAHGVPGEDAACIARCLMLAELRGVPSHGLSRLPIYLRRLEEKLVNPTPALAVEEPTPVCARLDGDHGFGFVVATRAMDMAIARAGTYGIGMVAAHRSTHFGMAACYLLQAVSKGYLAFVLTNASPAMPVWGGREPFLGTSPFAFGAPGPEGGPDIVLDMATSVVARGKIRRAAASGEPIPEGWALDADGNPTTDARAAYEGIILPLGGPKGSGLSLMMEVVAGVMSGSDFGGRVSNQYDDFSAPQDVGHTFIAIKPDLFVGGDYQTRISRLVSDAKGSTPIDPARPVLMPGEPEALRQAEREREGLVLAEDARTALADSARTAGIDPQPHFVTAEQA